MAHKKLKVLRQNANMKSQTARYTADGKFHHFRVKVGRDDHPSRDIGILNGGEVVPLENAEQLLEDRHNEEWGALDRSTVAWLTEKQPRFYQRETYSLWYDPDSIQEEGIQEALVPHSDEIVSVQGSPPVATVKTDGISALDLAEHRAVNLVSVAKGEPKDFSAPSPSETSAGYLASRGSYNSDGIYASGINVGIVEFVSVTECGVFENHEALDGASVSYTPNSPKTCSTDYDCPSICDWDCMNGTCTMEHPSQVASRISSSTDSTLLHAAQANIVVGNGASDIGDPAELAQVYSDLNSFNTNIVNESWGTSPYTEFHPNDYVRDWFARYRSMTFVKASGNYGNSPPSSGSEEAQETDCHALNALCVGGASAEGTYGMIEDDILYHVGGFIGASAWDNPDFSSSHPSKGGEKEVERPDVVSEGEEAWIMDAEPEEWDQDSGTSFASPSIAGLLALYDKECGPHSPAIHRASVRTAAFRKHSAEDSDADPRYPIPGDSPDSYAGTGIPLADTMRRYCSDQEFEPFLMRKEGTIDPTDDSSWDPIPGYMTPSEFPDTPNDNIVTHEQALRQADSQVQPLWQIDPERGARRVRVTFSYYTCPPSDGNGNRIEAEGVNKIEPAVDFDIALCSDSAQQCVAVSESEDDTNEGFDVNVPEELQWAEDLVVYLIKPQAEEVETCAGPNSGNEPWGSAIAVWPAPIFQ